MAKNKIQGSLDTNILVRLLIRDNPSQAEKIEKLLATGATFEIADSAILESVYVLEKVYTIDRGSITKNINGIIGNQQFVCNKILFEKVLPLYLANSKLSILDCALLVYARLQKATPLLTFDKNLVKKGEGDAIEP